MVSKTDVINSCEPNQQHVCIRTHRDCEKLADAFAEQERVADDLTRLIDTANAPIIGIDAEGRVNEWNQMAARITGFSKPEALGKNLVETFITEDYKNSVRDVLEEALSGKETSNYEFPLFTKSGKRVDILLNSTTRLDAARDVIGVVGVGQDITELADVRAEQARVADDLTRLIDTANAPIIGIDAQGRVNEWNQMAARITGFSKPEALGKNLVETFITEDYKNSVRDVLEEALSGKETSNYEFPLFTKSGKRVDILLNSTTRLDAARDVIGVVGVGQDITERLENEAQLRQYAKLEAIGNLTGGIAHDFNNLLTVISGNLSILTPREGDEREIIDDAMRAARDGSELVRNLLAFSRLQSLDPKPCSMDGLLHDFQRSFDRALGESVTLDIAHEKTGLAAFIDRPQFESALLNLCINARDAMPTQGKIVIRNFLSAPNLGDEPLPGNFENDDEQFICIQVTDNGTGIDPELLDKIIEPYFTTKRVGEGSGLGLSSVVGFVDQSGGTMRIFSKLGVGTTVELFLPRSSAEFDEDEPITAPLAADFVQGREETTIMVVDDEPDVLRLAVRWLKRSGYKVLQAASGDEALTYLNELNGDIDVLFSDIVMPGELNGWALAEEVSTRYPKIRIQLASGYAQERQEQSSRIAKSKFPVLFKPYNLTDVSSSVQRLVKAKKKAQGTPDAREATEPIQDWSLAHPPSPAAFLGAGPQPTSTD